jgi:hypothetical protein
VPHLTWVIDLERWVEIVSPGAYVSLVRYSDKGIEYNVYVENNNLIERDVEEE